MAGVKKSDIPEVAAFMPEFWGFMKKYWIPEDTDAYWEGVAVEASQLGRQYREELCSGLLLFFLDYLEWKGQKRAGRGGDGFSRWLYRRYQGQAREEGVKDGLEA